MIVYGWYVTLALLLSQPRTQRVYRRASRAVGRVSAGLMASLGLRLAFTD
ncbi:MAG: hypothetical protein ACRD2C_24915 [Acidimicrobiales bacterium]